MGQAHMPAITYEITINLKVSGRIKEIWNAAEII